MTNTTAILNHLQASVIIEIDEWANVFWVKAIVAGRKVCRFVSKKIGAVKMTEAQEYIALCKEIMAFDDDDLPTLGGSSKQVDWAEKIRWASISEAACGATDKESNIEDSLSCGFISIQTLKKNWALAQTKTEAKFWIDRRQSFAGYQGR